MGFAHPALAADFENAAKVTSGDMTALKSLIDHTLLKQTCTRADIRTISEEGHKYQFRSVCVPPSMVATAGDSLRAQGSSTLVCTVISFPNGYATTASKVAEVKDAVALGCNEIDFVQNVGLVKEGLWDEVAAEYKAVVAAADGRLVKVILETAFITPEEITRCAYIGATTGVAMIKTSTGFASRGASVADVQAMREGLRKAEEETGVKCGIKASGGVRDLETARAMIQAGATRIGTSSGIALVSGAVSTSSY
eukprot:Opistho-1_new@29903